MKTKRRTLWTLVLLIALTGGALALLTRQNRAAEQAELEAAEGKIPLLAFSTNTLEQITVTANGETNTLCVSDGSWTLAEDPAYHLDATDCNTMVTALSALNAKRRLTEQAGETYGLESPTAVVTVTAQGQKTTLTIGAKNPLTGDYYLKKAGDDALYTVAGNKIPCLILTKAELFGAFQPAGLTASSIEAVCIRKTGQDPVELKAVSQAANSDSSAYRTVWQRTDAPETTLDETKVNALLSALCSYVSAQDTAADRTGLTPAAQVTVTTADGTAELTYWEGADGWYLTVEGDDSLYTIDLSSVQTILAPAEELHAGA